MTNFEAQSTHGIVDHFGFVGTKEQDVAILCVSALQNFCNGGIVQVLDDGALQTVTTFGHFIDLDPGQSFGTIDLDEFGVAIDLAAADLGATGYAQGHHTTTGGGGRCAEHFEVHIAHDVGQFSELQLDAQVGLVRTETVHRFGVRHDRENAQVNVQHLLEHLADHALEHVTNVLFTQKGRFDIDLREFGLTVGAQVFVAEALGDLVVTVVAGHHQQLLEQLGRLGQRKELTIVHTAGHQVIACAFGRALGQHGRFDVDETMLVQKLAHFHGHFVAQHQVVLHVRTAQVQHTVCEACGFRQVVVVQQERRRDRWVEHRQLMAQDFNLAAFEVVVGGAFRTCAHQAFDLNAKLVAQTFGRFEHVSAIGVAHHLHITFAVTHVNEDHATVVTTAIDPTAQSDGLAHQGFGDETAVV